VRKTTKSAPRAAITQVLLTPTTITSATLEYVSKVKEEVSRAVVGVAEGRYESGMIRIQS
jgi:hypothetical protein